MGDSRRPKGPSDTDTERDHVPRNQVAGQAHKTAYQPVPKVGNGGGDSTTPSKNAQQERHTAPESASSRKTEQTRTQSAESQKAAGNVADAQARQWSAQAGGGHEKQVEVHTDKGAVSGTTFAKEGKQYLQTKDGSLYEIQQHNESLEGRLQPVKPDFSHAEAPPVSVVAPMKIVPDRQVEGALALQPERELSSPISRPTGSHESMFQQSARSAVILGGRNDTGTICGGTALVLT